MTENAVARWQCSLKEDANDKIATQVISTILKLSVDAMFSLMDGNPSML